MTPDKLEQRVAETGRLYTTLVRRVAENPGDAFLISDHLEHLSPPLWRGVVMAALQTPQEVSQKAFRILDASMAAILAKGAHTEVVADLYDRLPRETVALQETTLEVARQVVKLADQRGLNEKYPANYLTLLNNYVGRLLQNGKLDDAATEAARAMTFATDHASAEGIESASAMAYERQADILRAKQDYTGALNAMGEALQVYRKLSGTQPELRRDLAICLSNHVSFLTALNRPEDAVKFGTEAASLFGELVSGKKRIAGDFNAGLQGYVTNSLPNYATCLIALASALDKVGKHDESLVRAKAAVEILAQLVKEHAEFFPLLAQAHNNVAMALTALEDLKGAERAVSEAVAIFRRLHRLRPDSFHAYLAHVLRRHSLVLAKLGRVREALPSSVESVALYRKAESAYEGVYAADLAATQDQLKTIRTMVKAPAPARRSR